jgi:hypothetical protein
MICSNHLTAVWCKAGYLSCKNMQAVPNTPCVNTYRERFGSLENAYHLLGYIRTRSYGALREDANLRRIRSHFQHDAIAELESAGATVTQEAPRLYRINNQFNLRLAVIAATRVRNGYIKVEIASKKSPRL